jgi:hypothetical protein
MHNFSEATSSVVSDTVSSDQLDPLDKSNAVGSANYNEYPSWGSPLVMDATDRVVNLHLVSVAKVASETQTDTRTEISTNTDQLSDTPLLKPLH